MLEQLLPYLPMDRRHALARGQTLPDRTAGAALFADISGFTRLTDALVREMGPQRGAEELTAYLNRVYDVLVDEIHRWGGSAIAFAGDAVTCWFAGDGGRHATACALAMQEGMAAFAAVRTPFGSTVPLTMKASIAVGPARRFLVGDPLVRVVEVMAGATFSRLAAAEHLASSGEVILAPCATASLADAVAVREVRADATGGRCAVVARLLDSVSPAPWPPLDPSAFDEEQVSTWLLPPIYVRLFSGLGEFLAEIRPTVALFLRFGGIDYDDDDDAGAKLDAFIRFVESVVDRYEGTLIDLNIGDKGSYLYVNFGAPLAHENNAARAAAAALALCALPPALDFIQPMQIGVSQGRMRAGAYGGAAHRTYGVLGDQVNLAARLMMAAAPGQILFSQTARHPIEDQYEWEPLPPIKVKGKDEFVSISALRGVRTRPTVYLPQADGDTPLVGRTAELAVIGEKIARAAAGHGQIAGLVGDTGIGKSRLAAAAVHLADAQGFMPYAGACEAVGVNTSYLVWQPIWRGLFELDPAAEAQVQIEALRARLAALDPTLAPRLPLLGPAFGLAIPDNELTRGFDARLRKSALESMLTHCLRAFALRAPLVLVLEDCHWLDPMSHDLLEAIGQASADLPVLILLAYRPVELERLRAARVDRLPNYSELRLTPLPLELTREMARQQLDQLAGTTVSEALVERIARQAEGNPFYLQQLVNYVGDLGLDPADPYALSQLQLPASLYSLVLSRLDQLGERQKTLLKVASVVGRVFRVSWLARVYPDLGPVDQIAADLVQLTQLNLTAPDPNEPEPTYVFHHIVTQNVIYDSLLHMVRVALHAEIGRMIEEVYAEGLDQYLDLLAYHYTYAEDEPKQRYYLRRAGESAQHAYANEAAIDYYRRLLPLLPPQEQTEVVRKLGEVEQRVGHWEQAAAQFQEALALATAAGDRSAAAWSETAAGELSRMQGAYVDALAWFDRARAEFTAVGDRQGLAQVLHYAGNVAVQQGNYDTASSLFQESLALRRALGDRAGEARLLNNLAIMAEYRGDYGAARTLHEETLAVRRGLGDRLTIANSLNNLGNILLAQGDFGAARTHLDEAVALQRTIGDRWALANALNNLGNAVRGQGAYDDARQLYAESLAINKELGDRWALAYLLEDSARLASLEDWPEEAATLLAAAAAQRAAINAPLPPVDQTALDVLAAELRFRLGARAPDVEAAGAALSLPEAVEYARKTLAR